ncbi:MAG TPA: nucleotide exchange factor GrpE [Solirubrobacteraceae bacterium]|jgi:molecular chaperone GrpE|nr:nucleotide exchange factor GrpE [Solirubrobacteraceae bacterium]
MSRGHEQRTEEEVTAPAGAPSSPPDADGAAPDPAHGPGGLAGAGQAEAGQAGAGAAAPADATGEEPGGEPEAELDPEAQARALADRYLDLAQRTQADFDNFRKRTARDLRAAEARGISRLARELLPALDNLERALAAIQASDPEHDVTKGIRLVTAELAAALGRTGVKSYDPAGERFDPVQHEAVAQQPVEGVEPGTVVQVLQPGYRLNDAVLRPARVIVAG